MKNRIFAVILVIILTLGIVSCGASSGKAENNYVSRDEIMVAPGTAEKPEDTYTSSTNSSGDGSKIIKSATITAETQEYAKATEDLKALIASLGGHVANSSANENASYRNNGVTEKYANYTVKIPSESFDSFITSLSSIFNITNLSTATEDVSESYFTLTARIDTLQAKREGLVSMLQNVNVNTDFTTWQKINSELTEIDTQLNIYNEQLKTLENKVAYSTVTLSVREVAEYTETQEKSYGDKLVDALKGSLAGVVNFFKEALLVLIYLLPFILIFGGCTAVIIIVLKRKKQKNKKDDK